MQAEEKGLEVRNLIGGRWEERDGRDTEPVYDPATGEVVAETPLSTKEDVDRAVKQAEEAFAGWAATPVVERARVLFRFKALLEEHFEELRDLVTLENGKDARDAAGEVRRGIEVVEFACGMPTLMMGETVRDVAKGIDNSSWRYPLGVVAAITPFNFPCMVPLWTIPVAIGAGNAYILKPSERTPLCAVRLGELLSEAGSARWRLQHRQRGEGGRGRNPRAPRHKGRLLRGVPARRRARLHARLGPRQAGAGARGRQELHGRHARRRPGAGRPEHNLLGLRQRGRAVPRRQRPRGRRRGRGRSGRRGSRRPPPR